MMLPNPRIEEVLYVCRNMRQRSHDEIFGSTDMTPDQFAAFIARVPGFKWVGYCDGAPAAIIGAYQDHSGVWSLFGFGTDDWQKIWRSVTKVAKRDMMRAVMEAGAHRAHCITRDDHTETHVWLRALGAKLQVKMPAYGKDGSDYTMFAWLKETE
jgi:hypothetical protein